MHHQTSQDAWKRFIDSLTQFVHWLDDLKFALFKIAVFIVFVHWLIKSVSGELGY